MEIKQTIYSFLNYYIQLKEVPLDITNKFTIKYQQPIAENGYGYTNLAKYLQEINNNTTPSTPLMPEFIEFTNFLIDYSNNNISTYDKELITYFDKLKLIGINDPTSIKVDSINYEPNQKWHLFVSYFGSTLFSNDTNLYFDKVSCPELWLYLLETAIDKENKTLFNEKELNYFYLKAIEYKQNKFDRNDWLDIIKPYRIKYEKLIEQYRLEKL